MSVLVSSVVIALTRVDSPTIMTTAVNSPNNILKLMMILIETVGPSDVPDGDEENRNDMVNLP